METSGGDSCASHLSAAGLCSHSTNWSECVKRRRDTHFYSFQITSFGSHDALSSMNLNVATLRVHHP